MPDSHHRAPQDGAARTVLLGPQRFEPTLAEVVRSLGLGGTIAAITAGWQEREDEDAELREHLEPMGCRTINLRLHARGEEAFAADPALRAAHGLRQERLKQLQALYHMTLAHAKSAAWDVQNSQGDHWLLDPEFQFVIETIQRLDAHHMARVAEVHATFEETWRPAERPSIAHHRREIAEVLDGADAVAIAGGHVSVLVNRLRLFGVLDARARLPVIAWSAGAMTLADRIVLFHDSPPQGAGHAEILGPGLGRIPGVVPLPHAARRLRLEDKARVALLARRFAPAVCVALDPRTRLDWNGGALVAETGTRSLGASGLLEEFARA